MNSENNPNQEQDFMEDDRFRPTIRNESMASASMFLGFLSLISSLNILAAVPFGALSILLALLSRGRAKLRRHSKTAVIMSTIGITVSVTTTGFSFYTIYTNPAVRSQVAYIFNQYAANMGLNYTFQDVFPGLSSEDDIQKEENRSEDPANDWFREHSGEDGIANDTGEYYDSSSFWEDLLSGKDVGEYIPDAEQHHSSDFEDPYLFDLPLGGGSYNGNTSGGDFI